MWPAVWGYPCVDAHCEGEEGASQSARRASVLLAAFFPLLFFTLRTRPNVPGDVSRVLTCMPCVLVGWFSTTIIRGKTRRLHGMGTLSTQAEGSGKGMQAAGLS